MINKNGKTSWKENPCHENVEYFKYSSTLEDYKDMYIKMNKCLTKDEKYATICNSRGI